MHDGFFLHMKTFKQLFSHITPFENLLLAAEKAQKGKRYKNSVATFHFNLENNLLQLQEELNNQRYSPGAYRTFYIHDPKERMISAAPYRDRVIHHALCNVIEPIFERSFIFDSYANRKGKGIHRGIERYQKYARRYQYVLKCDIRKFFASIDHEILRQVLFRKIVCPRTRWLIDLIINNSNPQEEHIRWFPGDDLFTPLERRRGLPIGNLTSQFWGNVYLNGFDHFVKEVLRVPGYIRYVDDFVLLSDSKQELQFWKEEITTFLARLRLLPHPSKTQIHQTADGIPFLGYRVFPNHRHVRKEKVRRYRRYLFKNLKLRQNGKLDPQTLENQLNAWLGHIRHGQSKRLEYEIFWYLKRSGVELHYSSSGSWRVLEQQ